MIHKDLLKQLGLHRDANLSDRIRLRRNRLVTFFMSAVGAVYNTILNRVTYTCNHSTNLPGTELLSESNGTCANDVANAAHKNAGVTYNYVKEVLNRNSIDGKGLTLISSVNYDNSYNNAFYNNIQMVYGDGDGHFFKDFPKDLSVVAHELSHGITATTCNLYYYFQSGSLNEAFSDINGITCRHWYEVETSPETSNWLIGDKCIGDTFPGKALRSFKDEKAYDGDTQPKHMKDFKWTLSDNGGVHINSGVKNYAFYLLCINLKEVSYKRPIQIVWKAHQTLKSHASFKDAANAEYKAALELYGQEVATVVKDTYKQVGLII